MGEADASEPDWQQSFYGENYERLLEIKGRWDPWGLFWANTGVGSEGWSVKGPVEGWVSQNVSFFPFSFCLWECGSTVEYST